MVIAEEWPYLLAVLIYTVVAVMISYFSYQDYKNGIKALDFIIAYFSVLAITGVIQFLTPFLADKLLFFGLYKGLSTPLAYSPVRNMGIIAFLILFVLAEQILNEEVNKYKFAVIFASLIIYFEVLLYFLTTDHLILVQDILPFAQKTRLDELAYDVIIYLSLLDITYAFYKQFQYNSLSDYGTNIKIIFYSLVFFSIAYLYEVLEHFLPIIDIDFVYFTIPLFVSLAYVYTRNPHFSYLTPYDIHFLQISLTDGRLLYATEIKDSDTARDFFLSFSITNINTLLSEVLKSEESNIHMQKIDLNKGEIVFEFLNDIILSIYTDQSSQILRRSMRYFIREFSAKFETQISDIRKGGLVGEFDDTDELLKKCIPILSSKSFEIQINKK